MRSNNVKLRADKIIVHTRDGEKILDRDAVAKKICEVVEKDDARSIALILDEFGGNGSSVCEVIARIMHVKYDRAVIARVKHRIAYYARLRRKKRERRRTQVEG